MAAHRNRRETVMPTNPRFTGRPGHQLVVAGLLFIPCCQTMTARNGREIAI